MKYNLLMILWMLGCLTISWIVQAEEKKIYKWTDENGVTHYTETKPNDNYEEADLPPLSIIPSTPVQNRVDTTAIDNEEISDATEVETFTLIAPVDQQNLWGTGGKLTAQVSSLTPTQLKKYQVQFEVDGQKNKPGDSATQVFDGIYRGEHKVRGLLINRQTKKVMKETKTVTFFMHQNSVK